MNLKTADRLRLAVKVLQLAIAAFALYLAVFAGVKVNRLEHRVSRAEEYNRSQTVALFVMADAVNTLQRLEHQRQNPNGPPLPERPLIPMLPELDPTFQNDLKLKGGLKIRFDGKEIE